MVLRVVWKDRRVLFAELPYMLRWGWRVRSFSVCRGLGLFSRAVSCLKTFIKADKRKPTIGN